MTTSLRTLGTGLTLIGFSFLFFAGSLTTFSYPILFSLGIFGIVLGILLILRNEN